MKKQASPPAGFHAMLANTPKGAALNDAMHAMAVAYAQGQQALARVDGDKTLIDAQRLVRKASVFKSKTDRPMQSLQNAIAQMVEGKRATDAALEARVSFGQDNLAAISLATETRAWLRSLPAAERDMAIQRAANEFDLPTLRAVAAAPAVLSGLSEQIRAHARERYLGAVEGEALARSKALAESVNFARNFGDQMEAAIRDSVDWESAAEIEKSAAE